MESPSAQDRLIEAQEDFTSAESRSETTTTASTEEPSTIAETESTGRDEDVVGSSMTSEAEEVDDNGIVGESIDNEETFVSVESCEASLASLETSNDSSPDQDDGICDDADVIVVVAIAIAITIAVAITVAVSIAIAVAIVFAIAIAIAIAVFVDDSMRGETDGVLQDQRRRIRHLVADM
ncbi:hypothetical protein HZU73_06353 [Apis mellifera caucasica]|nr:hypothetical protein HZU73_06353 [Apis mellifera caucasica]